MKRETNTITYISNYINIWVTVLVFIYAQVFNVVDITTSLFLFSFLVSCILCLCMTLLKRFEIYRFILISYWGDKNRKRKIPCTDSNWFTLLWSKHSQFQDFIRRCTFLYSPCTFYMQFILTAGEWIWKWIGKFVKRNT